LSQLAIEVRGLVKHFEDVVAVDGIDLAIPAGECVGLLGPNGAGKTTTVEILEGLQEPTAGEVRVLGRSWREDPDGIRTRIGLALQETHFEEHLTVEETIRLFRSLYPRGLTTEQALHQVHLEEKRAARVDALSGGQRQRLALAVALVSDPELLFLDEPTTGLDPQSRRQTWDIVEGLKARGRTVLLTTHYMEEAARLCDRVAILDHGKVIALGTPRELVASLGAEHVVEFTVDEGASNAVTAEVLAALPSVEGVAREDGRWRLTVREVHRAVPGLLAVLAERGATPTELTTHDASLEDVFMALTGRRLRDG
jgi:ABC-2 type transport system ATP-binding protein